VFLSVCLFNGPLNGCVSVCLFDIIMSCAKMAEPVKMAFRGVDSVGLRNDLGRVQIPHGKG